MSRERFDWLSKIAGEVIATPGTESNVKEIFDKCWELRRSGEDLMIFNQFDEFGNYLWHYNVTGHAMAEVLEKELRPNDNFRGIALTTGSAGTIACGDYLKHRFPSIKVTASEALQCPTLLQNGFGAHRIEGIGDKHVPWIHNVANTDMITAIDDNAVVNISRLFNENAGKEFLVKKGVPEDLVEKLDLFGFSGIANLLSTIKMAKYYEYSENDVLVTVLTDSMELYTSRLGEYHEESGKFSSIDAAEVFARSSTDAWTKIHLPLFAPGLVVSAGILAALTLAELGATLIVAPPGHATITMRIYNYLHYGASSDVAGLCLMVTVLTLVASTGTILALWSLSRRCGIGMKEPGS